MGCIMGEKMDLKFECGCIYIVDDEGHNITEKNKLCKKHQQK